VQHVAVVNQDAKESMMELRTSILKSGDSVLLMNLESAFRKLGCSPDLAPFRKLIDPLKAYDSKRRNSHLTHPKSFLFF
jgi:hypothetical protein